MSSEASNNSNKSPQPERLVSGSTFDGEPYEVALETTEVARGASSKVFRGEMVGSPPRIVAVKVIPGLFDPVLEALLARELRTARAVSTLHPHILPFLGTANVGGRTAIVSTFMDNGNLKQYIKIHSGSYRKKLIVQVAEAVNFLHWTAGLVHGDIKCENILISNSGDALLADFGLSTFAEKSQSATTTMTAIRQMNTLQFAAPELLLGEGTTVTSKTRESDVYAFGMLVLEAVSGELPWPNHSSLAVMHKVCSGQHPARPTLDGLFVTSSHLWWQTCQSCWRFNPVERPQITDVLRALKPTEPVPSRDLPVRTVMMAATYMPDGKTIAAASEESIMLFTPATGHIRDLWPPGKADPCSSKGGLAVSPDGRRIACYANDTIIVLNAAFGTLVASMPRDGLSCVAYSRDGTRIASGARSGSVRLWDATTGAPVGPPLKGDAQDVIDVSFLRDGISLAATSSDGTIRLWNSMTCAPTATLRLSHPGGPICAVAFSPDDTHIVAGNEAGSVIIWDAREGTIVRTFDTQAGAAVSLAFSPSGQYIATGGSHGDIGIWDVDHGNRIGAALLGASSFKPASILSVAFSPDGRSLVYTIGGTVREWDLFDSAPGADV